MGLRPQQSAEVLELYLDGMSVPDIAQKLRVSERDVNMFIPKGDLNVAYQKVIDARHKAKAAKSSLEACGEADEALTLNMSQCAFAEGMLKDSIKASTAELKRLKASLKNVQDRTHAVDTALEMSTIKKLTTAYAKSEKALDKSENDLEICKIARTEADRKRQAKEQMILRAERLAEEAIITAAITGAKEQVAKSITDRLEREENRNV